MLRKPGDGGRQRRRRTTVEQVVAEMRDLPPDKLAIALELIKVLAHLRKTQE